MAYLVVQESRSTLHVRFMSSHFKHRLYYPTNSEYYRACSALIYQGICFRMHHANLRGVHQCHNFVFTA